MKLLIKKRWTSFGAHESERGKERRGKEGEKGKVGKDFTVDIFTVAPDQFNTDKSEEATEKVDIFSQIRKIDKLNFYSYHVYYQEHTMKY